MHASRSVACAAVLILGIFSSGCSPSEKSAAAAGKTADQGDGIHEYRAVCTEKAQHNGEEQVLSKWLGTKAQAQALGDYHSEFKDKGHRVRIEERAKPKKVT
jgi:hypothetical protein